MSWLSKLEDIEELEDANLVRQRVSEASQYVDLDQLSSFR